MDFPFPHLTRRAVIGETKDALYLACVYRCVCQVCQIKSGESVFLPHSCRGILYFEAEICKDGNRNNFIKYKVGVREVVCSVES